MSFSTTQNGNWIAHFQLSAGFRPIFLGSGEPSVIRPFLQKSHFHIAGDGKPDFFHRLFSACIRRDEIKVQRMRAHSPILFLTKNDGDRRRQLKWLARWQRHFPTPAMEPSEVD